MNDLVNKSIEGLLGSMFDVHLFAAKIQVFKLDYQ